MLKINYKSIVLERCPSICLCSGNGRDENEEISVELDSTDVLEAIARKRDICSSNWHDFYVSIRKDVHQNLVVSDHLCIISDGGKETYYWMDEGETTAVFAAIIAQLPLIYKEDMKDGYTLLQDTFSCSE